LNDWLGTINIIKYLEDIGMLNMSTEKKELVYSLGEGIDELPERHYAKGSKYDVILNTKFTKRYTPISIEGKDANYIRTQLVKIIKSRKITGLGVAVANGVCYILSESPKYEKEPTLKFKLPKA
jgi:hypothetical protein